MQRETACTGIGNQVGTVYSQIFGVIMGKELHGLLKKGR